VASHPKTFYTPEEYLRLERQAECKSEYFNGQIFAMAGASPEHNLIVGNIVTQLNLQLRDRPCTVYPSDLRVQVSSTGLYTYPDVIVICEEVRFADDENDTVTNPTLIVEVLSPTTKNYDRGEKFEHYRAVASLKEYILVAQDKHHVEQFVRQPNNQWILSETNRTDGIVVLDSIDCVLAPADIYSKVNIPGS
jgi:Uma2 family endonuclease